jgi:hypothetical protein
MQLNFSRIILGLMFLATVVVVAMLSDMLMVHITSQFPALACEREFFGVSCVLAPPIEDSKLVLASFLLLGLLSYLIFRGPSSASNYAPFFMFLSGILVVCTSFDLALDRDAYHMSKLYSSTVNTFSYILMFTFLVMVLIKEYDPVAFMISVLGSFTVKVATFIALGLLLPSIPGATGMFALFVTYSFAAFGLHLMMACRLFVAPR